MEPTQNLVARRAELIELARCQDNSQAAHTVYRLWGKSSCPQDPVA